MIESQPYVRLATRDDFEALVVLARRAFLRGPLANYMAKLEKPLEDVPSAERNNVEAFLRSLLETAFMLKRRITVVAIPNPASISESPSERLAAWATWVPPHAPPSQGLTVPDAWGSQALEIYTGDYWRKSDEAYEQVFASNEKGQSSQSVWHLGVVGVDPSEQGKGHLSRLAREAFIHAPGATFVLEANGTHAAARYEHLGFKHETSFVVGRGQVDTFGYRPSKEEDATGITFYVMVKWGSS